MSELTKEEEFERNHLPAVIIPGVLLFSAFEFAHHADPEADLYYNDYSMANDFISKNWISV